VNTVNLAVLRDYDLEITFIRSKELGSLGSSFGKTVCNKFVRLLTRVVHFFSLFSPLFGVQLAG
jgi:hypothetical protein